jgi:hypothetical protein
MNRPSASGPELLIALSPASLIVPGQKGKAVVKANYARYIERKGDIPPLSRYVATPPDAGGKVASPLEKIYSFFVKDLAEASARKRHSRPGNCLLLIRWVTGHKL